MKNIKFNFTKNTCPSVPINTSVLVCDFIKYSFMLNNIYIKKIGWEYSNQKPTFFYSYNLTVHKKF